MYNYLCLYLLIICNYSLIYIAENMSYIIAPLVLIVGYLSVAFSYCILSSLVNSFLWLRSELCVLISFCRQLPRPQCMAERTQSLLLLCLLLLLPFAAAAAATVAAAAAEAPLGLLALISELRCKFELNSKRSRLSRKASRERFKVSQIWCK